MFTSIATSLYVKAVTLTAFAAVLAALAGGSRGPG